MEALMRIRSLFLFLSALALGLAAGSGFFSTSRIHPTAGRAGVLPAGTVRSAPVRAAPPEAAAIPGDLTSEETRNIEVFRRAAASVVHIANIAIEQDFFSLDVFQIQRGTGSGFVWDHDGHIVTNYHVIEGGDTFRVRLSDQSEYEAKVVGAAAEKGVAVLRIKAPAAKLAPLARGTSRHLLVRQTVLAVR